MLGQINAIARNTFLEAVRQPIFFILILIGGGLQIVNTLLAAFSMGFTEEREVFGDDKMLFDMGLATVVVCCMLLAAFIATSVLSREIENKTALTVISKPVGRPMFVLGKYLGVSAAIFVAAIILTIFFFFALRHKVMSTARDEVDGPVVLCSVLAVLLSVGLGVWGNYFYNWVFSSTAVFTMLPTTIAAYVVVLCVNKSWQFQAITTDLKPQVMLASACAVVAIMVMTAVAVAASTRLGQVMTIVVCCGIFLFGLLSNHLLGRYAFVNRQIAIVESIDNPNHLTLARAGDFVNIKLKGPAKIDLKPGMSIYFGPDPNGLALAVPVHPRFTADFNDPIQVRGEGAAPSLIIKTVGQDNSLSLLNTGNLPVERPPQKGDFLFDKPTKSNWAARTAWSIVPNLQVFWLVDAVTQGHKIPARYVAYVTLYGGTQVLAFLSLAILMFQRRDVG